MLDETFTVKDQVCNPLEYCIQLLYVALLVFLGILVETLELAQPYTGFDAKSTTSNIYYMFFLLNITQHNSKSDDKFIDIVIKAK